MAKPRIVNPSAAIVATPTLPKVEKVEIKKEELFAETRIVYLNEDIDLDLPQNKINRTLSKELGLKIYSNHTKAKELAELMFDKTFDATEQLGLVNMIISSSRNNDIYVSSKSGAKSDIHLDEKNISLSVGDELDVFIYKLANGELRASYAKGLKEKNIQEIKSALGTNKTFIAKVVSMANYGYTVSINGENCFLPGGLALVNKLLPEDYHTLIGADLDVVISTISNQNGKHLGIVVDAKKPALEKRRNENEILLKQEVNKYKFGSKVEGIVNGITEKGIFVKIGSLSGLIHANLFNKELRDKVANDELKNGDPISCYVKMIDDAFRLVLSINEPKASHWDSEQFRSGSIKEEILEVTLTTPPSTEKGGWKVQVTDQIIGIISKQFIDKLKEVPYIGMVLDCKVTYLDTKTKEIYLQPISLI